MRLHFTFSVLILLMKGTKFKNLFTNHASFESCMVACITVFHNRRLCKHKSRRSRIKYYYDWISTNDVSFRCALIVSHSIKRRIMNLGIEFRKHCAWRETTLGRASTQLHHICHQWGELLRVFWGIIHRTNIGHGACRSGRGIPGGTLGTACRGLALRLNLHRRHSLLFGCRSSRTNCITCSLNAARIRHYHMWWITYIPSGSLTDIEII